MGSADPSKAGKYARISESRIERLEKELGVKLSVAQLRGKPRQGELHISVLRLRRKGARVPKAERKEESYRQIIGEKYDYVVRQVFRGRPASAARKEVKLDLEEFHELQKSDPTLKKEKGRYRISSKGKFAYWDHEGVDKSARIIGESKKRMHDYEDAYELALTGSTAEDRAKGEKDLKGFAKIKIYNAEGKRVYPATDIKIIKKALKSANADQRARFAERFYEREG